MQNENFLLDQDFLANLQLNQFVEKYAKVVLLDLNNNPIEIISGKVMPGGSINIDGKSVIRRTCSLTLQTDEDNIHSALWSYKARFQLYIGLKNNINSSYDDIVWFNQGAYLITSFNHTINLNSHTIAIQGKDKMGLLNGDLGGKVTSLTWDFGKENDIQDDGTIITKYIPIKNIIRELVHQFALEPYQNIIINDLDEVGLTLLEYRNPDYKAFIAATVDENEKITGISNVYLYRSKDDFCRDLNSQYQHDPPYSVSNFVFKNRLSLFGDNSESATRIGDLVFLYVEYGETIGYRLSDLIYPGDLIANLGEAVTSVLDKIIKMLGPYEYFYNVKGQFVFQKKKTETNFIWNTESENGKGLILENVLDVSGYSHNFADTSAMVSITDNPDILNIKNDFSLWGTRQNELGNTTAIHLRYAIDKKPFFYHPLTQNCYYISLEGKENYLKHYDLTSFGEENEVDWREIIYQMALDYNRFHNVEINSQAYLELNNKNFNKELEARNIISPLEENYPTLILYPDGITKYEQYYTDIEGFWRELYDIHDGNEYDIYPIKYTKYQEICKKMIEEAYETNESEPFTFAILKDWFNLLLQVKNDENQRLNFTYEPLTIEENSIDSNNVTTSIFYSVLKKVQILFTNIKNLSNRDISSEGYYSYLYQPFDLNTLVINENSATDLLYYFKQCDAASTYDSTAFYYIFNYSLNTYVRTTITEDAFNLHPSSYYTTEKVLVGEVYNYNRVYYKKYSDGEKAYYTSDQGQYAHWNKQVITNPTNLKFWFDFLDDDDNSIMQYSAHNIGPKLYTEKSELFNNIIVAEVPELIFRYQDNEEITDPALLESIKTIKPSYSFVNVGTSYQHYFVTSTQKISALTYLTNLLDSQAVLKENITLNSLPLYHLQPNSKIHVFNKQMHIDGDYQISKITIPLSYNGTMTINASKSPETVIKKKSS